MAKRLVVVILLTLISSSAMAVDVYFLNSVKGKNAFVRVKQPGDERYSIAQEVEAKPYFADMKEIKLKSNRIAELNISFTGVEKELIFKDITVREGDIFLMQYMAAAKKDTPEIFVFQARPLEE